MKGSQLDICLSNGCFRMQQRVFTCQLEFFNKKLYPVHWLRVVLANVSYGKDQRRLFRVNEKFSVAVKPLIISNELETLYDAYENSINFEAPYSVESCLLDGVTHNVFDSYVIEIRDGNRLIAAGIFDNGSRSIAGIMNFYHPDYRKHCRCCQIFRLPLRRGKACNQI